MRDKRVKAEEREKAVESQDKNCGPWLLKEVQRAAGHKGPRVLILHA